MLHGANYDEMQATVILTFTTKFSTLKEPYEVVVYAGDLREVAANRRERDSKNHCLVQTLPSLDPA
jgi:hypothetical protein